MKESEEKTRRRHMVRLWLRSFGLRRPREEGHFLDYDGVEKTLERKAAASGIV